MPASVTHQMWRKIRLGELKIGKPGVPIVVPFDPESSCIYQRLTENRMPPGISPNEERDHPNTSLLMRWMEQGAWCR